MPSFSAKNKGVEMLQGFLGSIRDDKMYRVAVHYKNGEEHIGIADEHLEELTRTARKHGTFSITNPKHPLSHPDIESMEEGLMGVFSGDISFSFLNKEQALAFINETMDFDYIAKEEISPYKAQTAEQHDFVIAP